VPDYAAHVFVSFGSICRLYKLTHSDLAQVTLQLGLSFRLSAKVFGLSALAGKGGGGGEFGGPAQKLSVSLLPTLHCASYLLISPPPIQPLPFIYFMTCDVFTLILCCTAASALHLALQSEFITRYALLCVPIRHDSFRPDNRVRS